MAAPDPNSRPTVHALVIAQDDLRPALTRMLQDAGFVSEFAADPYLAMSELCRRPLVYRTVVISLQGVYQEELRIIEAIRRRFPHIEVYLSHTDKRQPAMAEGMRLGAEGIVSEEGIHRTSQVPHHPSAGPSPAPAAPPPPPPVTKLDLSGSEPVLTAEELRALLEDEPLLPPAVGGQK